MLTTV
jgi:hypothetical protein